MGVPHLLNPFLLMDIQAASTLPGFPGGSVVKNLPASVGDLALIPGSGRCPGEANGSPLQYSYLGNPMDRGSWSMKSQMSQRTQRLNNSNALAVVTSAALNIRGRASFQTVVFFGYMSGSGISAPYGSSSFRFILSFFFGSP